MITRQHLKWIFAGILFLLGVMFGSMMASFDEGELAGRWLVLAGVAIIIVTIPATWIYWQSLDELAKEAHKSAWMWGGSFGMLIVALPLMLLVGGIKSGRLDFGGLDPEIASLLGFSAGAGITIFGAVGGYLIAWVIYWLRKR